MPQPFFQSILRGLAIIVMSITASQAQIITFPLSYISATSPIFPISSASPSSPSLNSACSSLTPILEVNINPQIEEKVSYALGFKELTQEASFAWEPYVDRVRGLNLGYTEAEYEVSYSFASKVEESPNRTVSCAVPGVRLNIGFKSLEIKVAQEIAPTSCLGQEVLNHERKHVKLYKEAIVKVKDRIVESLTTKLNDKVFVAQSPEEALTEANLYLENFVYSATLIELDKIRTLHSQIDTPQEYERMSQVCNRGAMRFTK